ncbi:MAG: GGDEF domain-containing protein, partial [Actinobacteria bacterium]|nr:GGDEF domain-containing protein [Actinomycetota bacterium]
MTSTQPGRRGRPDGPLDPPTRLVSRSSFMESVHRAAALAQRQQWGVAVLALDVDGFHRVNEDLGYEAGDEVLTVVAERLCGSVREHDTTCGPESVTRLGGDRFLVLCEAVTDAAAAGGVARRVTDALSAPIVLGGRSVLLTVSIGISFAVEPTDAQQIVLDAEAALRR